MNRVGEKIKQIRIDSGLSQKQLAKKLGVAESFINEVEQGRKVVSEGLMDKITKILGKDLNDISMSVEEEVYKEEKSSTNENVKKKDLGEKRAKAADKDAKGNEIGFIKEVWNAAFGSVLKNVPCYKYNLNEVVATRQMPLVGNKIEGHALDKVFFIEIEEDDMIGFRIAKGDIAFAHTIHELDNNAICLVEYNGQRVLRQVKRLDNSKVLLISNKGTLRTEAINIKDVKPLAKLDRVEIRL